MSKKWLVIGLAIMLLVSLGGAIISCETAPTPVPAPEPKPTPAPAPAPEPTSKPAPAPVSEISALDIAARIFDNRLSDSQRDEMWRQEYKGKRIRWYVQYRGSLEFQPNAGVKKPGEAGDIEIRITWAPGPLDEPKAVEVLIIIGTLAYYFSSGFKVEKAQIDSLVLKKVWSREAIGGTRGVLLEGVLTAVDQKYVYSWDTETGPVVYYQGQVYDWGGGIYTYDKTNGYFVSEFPFRVTTTREGLVQEIKRKISSMAQGQVVFAHKLPFETRSDGFSLKFSKNYFDVFDRVTNRFLWGYRMSNDMGSALLSGRMIFFRVRTEMQALQLQ